MTMNDIPLLFGPYGSPVLQYVDQLSAHNVNTVWFHGFDGHAFEACAQHNLAACVDIVLSQFNSAWVQEFRKFTDFP